MKAKDDVFVLGEERVVTDLTQPMRVFAGRLQFHQIDNIDHPDFQIWQVLTKDRNRSKDF